MGPALERIHHFSPTETQAVRGQTLTEEMAYLRQYWQEEGMPADWRLLDKTGFQVGPHVDMLYDSLSDTDSRQSQWEKVNGWLTQTDEDIKGFNLEYLAEGLVFPIFYRIDRKNQQVVAPLYGHKPIDHIVSEKERNGVVKQTVVNKLTPVFLHAPENSIAVMHSPSGWSGLQAQSGQDITFPDSQTYIFQKKGEEIVGFTVRTDFKNGEHRDLIERLGGKRLADEAPVEEYVSSVGFINGRDFPKSDIGDVVNQMRIVRFENNEGSDKAYKNRSWDEVFTGLQNRENLWKFDEKTAALVGEFKEWVLANNWTRRELEEALAVTILRISSVLTGTGRLPSIIDDVECDYFEERMIARPAYGAVLDDVEQRGGCAGGGSTHSILDKILNKNSLTPRFEVTLLSEDKFGSREFECPDCGEINTRPKDKLIERCKHCRSKAVSC